MTAPSLSRGAALLLGAALAACVQWERGGLFPPDRDEVHVEFFGNETFYREVEFNLTEQVVAEIVSRPGLSLSSKETAEVILTGRVVKVRQNVLSEDPNQNVTNKSTTVTVVMEIWDAHTGRLIKSKRLSQRGEFVPGRIQDVDTGLVEANRFLARDIVRELERDF